MSTLILTLPLAAAPPEHDYVLTPDGQQIASQGRTVAAMLPATAARGHQVVAVVPARALSWHRIAVPDKVLRGLLSQRLEAARARGVLAGVLEEQLLDEPEQLHFAVFAAQATDAAAPAQAWVAACNRAWLQDSLRSLEQAGHPVDRIVAEGTPLPTGQARLLISDAQAPAQLLLCSDQGVTLLPLQPASLALAQAHNPLEVLAEPAVMALAESHFGSQARLQVRAQALLQAAQSPWNLAQFELGRAAGGALRKRIADAWQLFWQDRAWRPLRWGLLLLVLVQVAGLNALAWRQRQLQEGQRSAIADVLRQSFPQVQLVVDAPLQMQRAVDDLAAARGVGAGSGLGRALAVLGQQAPASLGLNNIELSAGQLRLQASDAAALQGLLAPLQGQGLGAQWQNGTLLIDIREAR